MDSRRIIPLAYDERHIPSGSLRRGPLHHPIEPLPLPVLIEEKLASQAAEIERLSKDNRTLTSSHLALRKDLVAAKLEAEKLREHIRRIQNEGDSEIQILLDKTAKTEADIRAGENIKKEFEEARIEAKMLIAKRLELTSKVQQMTLELENACSNVKKLPEMREQLDRLRQERERLRKTFEYEKGRNIKKVEQLKNLEKDLIDVVEEVERLRTEVLNAEKRDSAPIPQPQNGPYIINSDNIYALSFYGNGVYPDTLSGSHLQTIQGATVEGMNLYAGDGFAVSPQIAGNNAAGNPAWEGVYDNTSHTGT